MGNRKILAVEDPPFLLKSLAFILEKARRRSRLSSS